MPNDHDVMLAIGRLEGKLDSLLQMRLQQQEEIKELDVRVRQLEYVRGHMMGYAAAIGAFIGIAANYVIRHFI
jgi:hypothetical protein